MFKRIAFNLVVNLHLEKTMVFVVAVQKLSRYNWSMIEIDQNWKKYVWKRRPKKDL